MLENLTLRMKDVFKSISGNSRITDSNIKDALRQVKIALLEADVSISVVKTFIDEVSIEALGQKVLGSLMPQQAFIDIVHKKLIQLMGDFNDQLILNCVPPAVILMSGLQGAGKTTTVGKLAKRLTEIDKKKVLVVSLDVYRPAAMEQLQLLAQSINVEYFNASPSDLPAKIAEDSMQYAKKHFFDVVLIDTAGRLSIDQDMMNEIKMISHLVNPIETLFIADAMLGQDAVNTALAFDKAIGLTGVILTKMDGDARGGAALSIRKVLQKPIKFLGVSEKLNGLEPFYPDRLASRILGMGDVLSLIDEVKNSMDKSDAQKMLNKVKTGKKFDLNDFKIQFQQVNNMGGMDKILEKMPPQLVQNMPLAMNEKIIKKYVAIIDSMTKIERSNPDILKATRKKRIANGSGTQVQDVNQLLKQFEQTNQMMKKFSNNGLMKLMGGLKNFKSLM